MYSRPGKSTINNYLCFNKDPQEYENVRLTLVKRREKRIRDSEKNYNQSPAD